MAKHAAPRPQYRWWIPATVGAIAVALVLMILVIDRDGEDGSTPTAGGTGPESDVVVTEVADPEQSDLGDVDSGEESDPMSDGPVDAPVKLVIFSDYQCPYCAEWSQETLPTMMEYVDDGDMRIEWRDVNVFGDASEQAAKAAHAAALQDAYWEYHDALFADGEHRPESGLTADALTDLADDLGLDTDQFREDMDSPETQETVEAYAQTGLDLGAFSTPTFLVGGEPIVGAQPTDVFVDAVDAALASQG